MNEDELRAVIAEAARTKAVSLQICNEGLTSLPPEIGELIHLQSLDLSENALASLPPEIGKLTGGGDCEAAPIPQALVHSGRVIIRSLDYLP